jgi:DNA repair exonuclease SbcCD ATPase subunit
MRIRELTIENFRKFRQLTVLSGFDDGLNLVCEPNEMGKSTVLEALRAVLFERYSAKSDRIRSFRPYGDEVAPTIGLTFEVNGEQWTVKKRFLQNPSVLLEGPSGREESDAAEEKLQILLGFARAGNRGSDDESRGALGLLWVEQGTWSLAVPGNTARKTLEDVLAGEIGAVTGGRRTTAVLQAIDKQLSELLTATGKPTRRLHDAHVIFEAARGASSQARDELLQFENTVFRLEGKRQELRRLGQDINNPETSHQLEQLEKDLVRAQAAAHELATAELRAQQTTANRESLEGRQGLRARLKSSVAMVKTRIVAIRDRIDAQAEALSGVRDAEQKAVATLDALRDRLRKAEAYRDAALAAQAMDAREGLLRAAFARLDQAVPLAAQLEGHTIALKGNAVIASVLRKLEELETAVEQGRAAAQAGAATFRVDIASTVKDARLNGNSASGIIEGSITDALTFELPGYASISIEPASTGESAQSRLRAAEQDRNNGLARLGVSTIAEARARARDRAAAEQALATLNAQLGGICVADTGLGIAAGFESLRDTLASKQRPKAVDRTNATEKSADALSEGDFQDLRAQERASEAGRQAALAALQAAEVEKVQLAADLARELNEETRLNDDLAAEFNNMDDTTLTFSLAEAHQQESRLLVDLNAARRAAEGLKESDLRRKKEGVERRQRKLQEDRVEILQEIARLEVEAKTKAGTGPASRAQAADEELEFAQASYDRLRDEAGTLQLLRKVLTEAQQDAARRYLAPITARIQPYVRRLLPTAALSLGEDYRPRLLVRSGREEAADDLSKGTQEQLAVLTRLAFADLLLEKGKPASLVLDDALVFADDDRFETMTDILSEAATRMQVIVLSCRTSAYRGLDGKRISIS